MLFLYLLYWAIHTKCADIINYVQGFSVQVISSFAVLYFKLMFLGASMFLTYPQSKLAFSLCPSLFP